MFLFIRFLPIIAIFEMRGLLEQTKEQETPQARPASAPAE
jgi:hypothetical protein